MSPKLKGGVPLVYPPVTISRAQWNLYVSNLFDASDEKTIGRWERNLPEALRAPFRLALQAHRDKRQRRA